jgi:hypothetical protein
VSAGAAGAGDAECRNCRAALAGPYCAACGQRDVTPDPTVRELAVDAAQEMLGVDGKLAATMRRLPRPGRLTVDYLAGRRAAHVGPVRVYLVVSAVLFAVMALQPRDAGPANPDEFTLFGVARVGVTMDSVYAERVAREPRPTLNERLGLRIRTAIKAGPERHAELERRVVNTIPQAFFLLVPAYAGVVALVAPRPRRHYPAHLCYALHVHAFVFGLLSLALALRLPILGVAHAAPAGGRLAAALDAAQSGGLSAAVAGSLAYVWAAHRRVYGGSWAGAAVRVAASTLLYLVLVGFGVVVLLLGVLLVG